MDRIRFIGPSIVLAVLTLGVLLAGPSVIRRLAHAEASARVEASRELLASQTGSLTALNEAFRAVAEAVEPSVVHISVTQWQPDIREVVREIEKLPEDERPRTRSEVQQFMRELRERTPEPGRGGDGEGDDSYERFDVPEGAATSGSGWVYRFSDGRDFVVTNHHVVERATRIVVKFFDSTERVAEVVGSDEATDIAVLRVEGAAMHPAAVSGQPAQQGDIVFAFGSPLGFEFSISQGIVSAKGRQLGILRTRGFENFIQTDAAINQGNSGGPLTNVHGEVVGMNTAIFSQQGSPREAPSGFLGVGFAIPSDIIVGIVDALIEMGEVRRGMLGISMSDGLTPEMAATFNYRRGAEGVLVDDAIPGFPAAAGGIQPGDIIMEIDGEPMRSTTQLRFTVAGMGPGREVVTKLWRWDAVTGEGGERTVTVRLTELTDRAVAAPRPAAAEYGVDTETPRERELDSLRRVGITGLATVTADLVNRSEGMLTPTPGVAISSLRRRSVAYEAGLRETDVITQVQGVPVRAAADLVREINRHDLRAGVRIRARIVRGPVDRYVYVLLRLPGG